MAQSVTDRPAPPIPAALGSVLLFRSQAKKETPKAGTARWFRERWILIEDQLHQRPKTFHQFTNCISEIPVNRLSILAQYATVKLL
jgi:hypothetical protein